MATRGENSSGNGIYSSSESIEGHNKRMRELEAKFKKQWQYLYRKHSAEECRKVPKQSNFDYLDDINDLFP